MGTGNGNECTQRDRSATRNIKPTHRLITNVAAAHLEGLGTIENVLEPKASCLMEHERETFCSLMWMMNWFVNIQHHHTQKKKIFVGRDKDADFRLEEQPYKVTVHI